MSRLAHAGYIEVIIPPFIGHIIHRLLHTVPEAAYILHISLVQQEKHIQNLPETSVYIAAKKIAGSLPAFQHPHAIHHAYGFSYGISADRKISRYVTLRGYAASGHYLF